MLTRRSFNTLLGAAAVASLGPTVMEGQTLTKASNVVLVHGLYADASCWIDVIPYLQNAGLNVTAVQNPLTSLAMRPPLHAVSSPCRRGPPFSSVIHLPERLSARLEMTPMSRRLSTWRPAPRMPARILPHSPQNFPNPQRARESCAGTDSSGS
jgi:hypothetical protein